MTTVDRPRDRVPLPSTGGFARDLALARATRIVLAVAVVAAAATCFVLAVRTRATPPSVLPQGADGVVVVDVSGSIAPSSYERIATAFDDAIESHKHYGLVFFSDVAYEALPPGTAADQLRAAKRFFLPVAKPPPPGAVVTPRIDGKQFLVNPWAGAFTGGTRMSEGLELARDIVLRDRMRHPTVILVSDLGYSLGDANELSATLADLRRRHIALRVVSLGAGPEGRALFERAMQGDADFEDAPTLRSIAVPETPKAPTSLPLVTAAIALLLLLAVNELRCARLRWRTEAAA